MIRSDDGNPNSKSSGERSGQMTQNRKSRNRYRITYYSLKRNIWALFRTLLITGLAFLIIQPLLLQLSSSFKGVRDLFDNSVFLFPKAITLDNYIKVWEYLEYPSRLAYTVLYCSLCAILQTASCTLAAYGISRFQFKARKWIMGMAIFTLIVPAQTVLLPQFLQFHYFSPVTMSTFGNVLTGLNLIGTPVPLILLSMTAVSFKNGLFIFMLRQYFKNLPRELEEVASIDGCGFFMTFMKIILPGAKTMMITVLLFAFVFQWNDYFFTTVLTPGLHVFSTIIVNIGDSIAVSQGIWVGNMHGMLYDSAAMILFILPLIILYAFTQRYFVESIERSGLVG